MHSKNCKNEIKTFNTVIRHKECGEEIIIHVMTCCTDRLKELVREPEYMEAKKALMIMHNPCDRLKPIPNEAY